MRAITFDIESISDAGYHGRLDIDEQELTVVAIHDSETGEFSSYLREDLPKLWPILERADLLIGYNSNTFDIPLLNRYYPGDLTRIPSLDLLVEVQNSLGRRLRLQALADATLGKSKSGDGGKAMEWWRAGNYDKVREYCVDDVRITRALYDYAKTHGKLKYKDLRTLKDIKLDTSHWESTDRTTPTLTHALPL